MRNPNRLDHLKKVLDKTGVSPDTYVKDLTEGDVISQDPKSGTRIAELSMTGSKRSHLRTWRDDSRPNTILCVGVSMAPKTPTRSTPDPEVRRVHEPAELRPGAGTVLVGRVRVAGLVGQGLSAATRRGYVQTFKGFHAFLSARKAGEIEAAFGVRMVDPVDGFNAARHVDSSSPSARLEVTVRASPRAIATSPTSSPHRSNAPRRPRRRLLPRAGFAK